MVEFDGSELEALAKHAVSAEQIAEQAEAIQLAALRATSSREEAVERGRRLGEQTAADRNESKQEKQQRVARAMAYAAWEYDGKPQGGAHLVEFGVSQPVGPAAAGFGADWKKGK